MTTDGGGIEPLPVSASPELELVASGLEPGRWSAAAGTVFETHSHARTKHLYVTRGRIAFNELELEAPSGIRIAAGCEHRARVGAGGVECVEAFEP